MLCDPCTPLSHFIVKG